MTKILSTALAYLILISTVYYETFYRSNEPSFLNIPITATIFDSLSSDKPEGSIGLCWYNPDSTLERILAHFPADCTRLSPGVTTHTYVGHQFFIVPFHEAKSIDDNSKHRMYQIFAIQSNRTLYDIRQLDELSPNRSLQRLLQFEANYEDMIVIWQNAIIHRRLICLYYAFFLIIVCVIYVPSTSMGAPSSTNGGMCKTMSTGNSKDYLPLDDSQLRLIQDSLAIPRHALKSIAVVAMVLNHIGHNSLSSQGSGIIFKPYWTVLADAGWSSQVFCWLAGLNTSQVSKSSEMVIVLVFVGLELFVHLPSPITYENLLTIVSIRFLCDTNWVSFRREGGRCIFADMHILIHALLCCAAIHLLEKLLGADGLKMINISGLMYAMSGRIFAVNMARGRSWELSSKVLLWHAAATYSELTGITASWDAFDKHSSAYYAYCGFFVGSLMLQFAVLTTPVTKPWFRPSFYMHTLVARYSLEIYVIHFILLLAYNQLL